MMTQKQTKIIEPKVYGLLLEYPHTSFLSVQRAYSLEEAVMLAKAEFKTTEAPTPEPQSNTIAPISLFAIKTFAELKTEFPARQVPIQIIKKTVMTNKKQLTTSSSIKNNLMKQIAETKDMKIFKEYQKIFTSAERKFLKKQIQ